MYTVGIKRRFGLGFRKEEVQSHYWENGRIVLLLADDSQESLPGHVVYCLKVYANFWKHEEAIWRQQQEVEKLDWHNKMAAENDAEQEKQAEQDRQEVEAKIHRLAEQKAFDMIESIQKEKTQEYKALAPVPLNKPIEQPYDMQMAEEVMRRATNRVSSLQA